LLAAFNRFSDISSELTAAYAQLERRVAEFNRSLVSASGTRRHERAEKERLAERLSRLLEALPAAVVLVDGRGRVDQFNQAAQNLFPSLNWGRRWREVLGENLEIEFDEDGWLLRNAVHVSVTRRPLGDQGQILVLVDQTERRLLQGRVQQQERLSSLGEMAARLAHQVRTPLAAAVLYADQLSRDDVSTEQRRRFGAKLSTRLRHTEQVVADMLAFARGDRFRADTLVLQQILQDAADIVAPKFQAADATLLNQTRADTAISVLGNREALTGAVINVLNNAVEHGGERVQVTVALEADTKECRVLIEDSGPGVAAAIRAQVFEPFFTTRRTGTGLGLAVVNAVILEHGGRLTCHAGPGGRFEIVLPLAAANGDSWRGRDCV
jgi:two-component system sensor histidine kinase FlrB